MITLKALNTRDRVPIGKWWQSRTGRDMLNPMRQRLLKYLRIAVTAVSLLVCALLIMLWVRSYRNWDTVTVRLSQSCCCGISSQNGTFEAFMTTASPGLGFIPRSLLQYERSEVLPDYRPNWGIVSGIIPGFDFERRVIRSRHWFYLIIFATIAALPWIKWRFSLRTLLIALTLFAVLFGAIAISMSS